MITCTFEDGGTGKLRHVVIDTLVLKENKILLVKRVKQLLEGGKWGVIGGFVEPNETLKESVAREVHEETGYNVENITLLTVIDRPDRPHEDRQNISFVFFCTATNKDGEKDWESEEVRWFSLDELPSADQLAFDHDYDITLYKEYLAEHFSLPFLSK